MHGTNLKLGFLKAFIGCLGLFPEYYLERIIISSE